ncbi:unnamed protein product [Lathyrus oleraceus]
MLTLKGGSRPPWVGLGASVWVQIASGNTFTFPLYSHSLKSVLGFNQRQITLLGVANDIGENVGLLPGIACNRFPPWLILSVGAFASLVGYGILWLAVTQTLPNLPYLLLWFALVIASNSSAWLTTSVLVTNMRNFPVSRGKVAGILKGYGGLSAAVFTQIYSLLLHNDSSKFLMLLTIGIPVVCFSMMFLVRPCTPALDEDSTSSSHFIFIQCASVILGVYLLATTIFGNLIILSDSEQPLGSSDSLGQGKDDKIEPLLGSSSTGALGSSNDDDSSEVAMLLAIGEGAIKQKKRKPKRGEDFKFTEAIVKADFWLLFFVYFVGVGTGVTVLNNLAQIGIAQGEEDTTTLLSIFSFCNFVGRLGGGVVSEHFVRTKLLPRTFWLTCTQTIMILVYLLFAFAVNGSLYPAVAFLGVCYGVQVSIMIPTVSELFGLKNFGVLGNVMSLGNPLGATIFSALLAGSIYDKEAAKQHGLNLLAAEASCIGADCFKLTFFILSGVCAAGIFLSVILTLRIRPVYQMLYAGGSFRIPQPSPST